MKNPGRIFGILASLFFVVACLGGPAEEKGKLSKEVQEKFAQAIDTLSSGDYRVSNVLFEELRGVAELECEVDYGLALGGLLQLVDEFDQTMDLVRAVIGDGIAPAQFGVDPDTLLASFAEPYEKAFGKIRVPGQRAVDNRCRLYLPDSLPIELTTLFPADEEATSFEFVDLRAEIGFEFDSGFMRALLAGIDSVQAVFDFVLAHRFALEKEFTDALDVVSEAADRFQQSSEDVENGDAEETERETWVGLVRSVGVIFDLNPNLLALKDGGRMSAVDDDIERVVRNLFYRDADGNESGLVVDLLGRNGAGVPLTNNTLAIIDRDGNSQLSAGDSIFFGLRSFKVDGRLSFSDTSGGVELTIPESAGDIAEATRLVHEMLQNLGNQMEAVEDNNVDWERFGVADFNEVAAVLALDTDPFPEIAEFDLRAYFKSPVPVRGLLPYWYDDGESDFNVFLIEGESKVTTTAEPFIVGEDGEHFPESIMFSAFGQVPKEITGLRIQEDDIFAGDSGFVTPFPYVALQLPSFGDMLYLNTTKFPVAAEGSNEYRVADSYTLNKAVNAIGIHYQEELKTYLGE